MKFTLKLTLKLTAAFLAVVSLLSFAVFQASCADIPQKVFRLHILANSDSTSDQQLKLKVRDEVLLVTGDMYKNAQSKESAMELTEKNLKKITEAAQKVIEDNGYSYSVSCEIKKVHFDTRHYDSVTMPCGVYDALQIKIGQAEGKNWWCVMFPSLCVGAATDYKSLEENVTDSEYSVLCGEKTEYKFFALECLDKLVSFFSTK